MKAAMFVLIFLVDIASAHAEVENILGRYVNASLDGQFGAKASVEIKIGDQGEPIMIFDVACGTKLQPKTLAIHTFFGTTGTLTTVDRGSSQCDIPENARYFVVGNKLTIYTDIRVPGFSGAYEFTRE